MGRTEAEEATARLRDDTEEVVELAGRKFRGLSRLGHGDTLASAVASAFPSPADLLTSAVWGLQEDALASLTMPSAIDALASAMSNTSMIDPGLVGGASDQVGLFGREIAGDLGSAASLASNSTVIEGLDGLSRQMVREVVDVASGLSAAEVLTTGLADSSEATLLESIGSARLGEVLASSFALDIAAVASPILDAQEQYSSLLAILPEQPALAYARIAEQSGLLTSTLDHIFGIQRAETALLAEQASALANLAWIPDRLADVTTSFADVFRTEVGRLRLPNVEFATPSLAERLAVTTAPVMHYTGAVRYLVEAEVEQHTPAPSGSTQQSFDLGNERLDPFLRHLAPDFPDMRRGAWLALASDNPDRLRHAATSQRDLMTQLLRLIVPDLDVAEDDQPGSKIKARVKAALGGSDSGANFVKTLADAVYSHYSMLSKYTHTNQKHVQSLHAILVTGEGLIEYILVNIDLGEDC